MIGYGKILTEIYNCVVNFLVEKGFIRIPRIIAFLSAFICLICGFSHGRTGDMEKDTGCWMGQRYNIGFWSQNLGDWVVY